jgi:hypothetical protein
VRRTAILLAVLLAVLAPGIRAQPRVLSVDQYRAELSTLQTALADSRFEDARAGARSLRSARVALGAEAVATDASLLAEVEAVRDGGQAAAVGRRIATVVKSLPASGPAGPDVSDRALLERLRAQETPRPLQKGGPVGELALKPLSFPERVLAALQSVWDWLGRGLRKLVKLLLELWPQAPPPGSEASSFNLNLGVLALVAAITAALGVLAYRALRRGKATPEPARSRTLASSSRDQNPLSREADEWERYAAELAAAGRRREAIRAFYHAVLTALFRSGALHYQKSCTNWEYASAVPPEARFRPSFLELTRIFDREWYGHDKSAAEALARSAEEARRILKAVRGAEGAA